ncbi:MacB-like periplasmic core domain protein [uncultured archaeon]|nr:MacB-like periplasmic core domain protein [uncultured archaeon]
MISEFLRISIEGLKNKGARSWLTMLGIIVGIVTIVSLLSLGQGLQDAINKQFDLIGKDTVYIIPSGSFGPSMGKSLTKDDFRVIKTVKGVEDAAQMVTKFAKVQLHDETKYTFVSGLPTDNSLDLIVDGENIKLNPAHPFDASDANSNKVAIGYNIATGVLFKDHPVSIGERILIEGVPFRVAATVSKIGNPQDDTNIYIPIETARTLFNEPKNVYAIVAKVKSGEDNAVVAENIKQALRRYHDLKKGEEFFDVYTKEQLQESFDVIFSAVQAVLFGIAAISLVVGGIGIMNTMYTSVLERTKEIGIMKSIGATNGNIRTMFLIEAGLIGSVGGAVGCVFGVLLAKSFEYIAVNQLGQDLIQASVSWQLILGALSFSFVVGCLSGVLPAQQAASLKPVDALRYE